MSVINITTQDEFNSTVISSDKVVLVDFWAEWCPPCRAMAPVLEQLGTTHDRLLDIVKVDIEASKDNAALAQRHGVQGIPNMVVYKNGQLVHHMVGMRPAPVLERELGAFLSA